MSSCSLTPALRRSSKPLMSVLMLSAALLLGGCNMQVLSPSGDVASQQAHILAISTGLMLLIIVPVMALTALFAWRYRASNKEVEHRPDWDHSMTLELVIWSAPLLIVMALGAITWTSTHVLDPYRPLDRIAPGKPVAANAKVLEVQVVALNWKWLFIYPELGVATVNELVLPIDRQVRFSITSSTVMNSFYIPALAGQIYAMPGMETKLHAVLNKPGTFRGISANYSGAGFSGMHFPVRGVDEAGFARWAQSVRSGQGRLDAPTYLTLAKPSENVPAMHWAATDPALFGRIVRMCVEPGSSCAMAHHGTQGDAGQSMPLPVNDSGGKADEPEGALLRDNDEKGTSVRPASPADNRQNPSNQSNPNQPNPNHANPNHSNH